MSNSKSSASGGGLGVCGVLTVLFVALKLLGVAPVAAWSWIWVLSPLWIGAATVLAILGLFLLVAFIAHVVFNR
jgi:hypothetical protein